MLWFYLRGGVLQQYEGLSFTDDGDNFTIPVAISFCPPVDAFTEGITVSQDKILLNSDYMERGTGDLAVLLAHELKHVEQYIRWGFRQFACRYSNEILRGKGFGRENEVEKEAYDFGDSEAGWILS